MLTLGGCSSTTEINRRSIVHAVGVDKADGGYEVSLQIFSPTENGSDTPISISSANTQVISATGETVYQAVKNCEYLLGGEIFMGHNKFIIFGSSLYDEDLLKLLDWFRKENENYLGVTVGYAQKSAKEILNVKLTDGASSVESMENVQKYASEYGITAKGDLLLLYNSLRSCSGSGLLPIFSVVEQEQNQESTEDNQPSGYLKIYKTAVLKNRKMVGYLESDEMSGVVWLRGEMEKNMLTVWCNGRLLNVEVENQRTKASLDISDGVVEISVKIKATAKVVEELDDQTKREICRACQEKILSCCQSAVDKTVNEMGTDVLRIEKLLKFYKPQIFRQYENDFEKVISACRFNVSAQVEITN